LPPPEVSFCTTDLMDLTIPSSEQPPSAEAPPSDTALRRSWSTVVTIHREPSFMIMVVSDFWAASSLPISIWQV